MSCKCNGIAMREGPANFALMPATVHHHGYVKDPRPLTREQIASIPGVKYPAPSIGVIRSHVRKGPLKVKITAADIAKAVEMYAQKYTLTDISTAIKRNRATVRLMLVKAGVYVPVTRQWFRSQHLSRKAGAA